MPIYYGNKKVNIIGEDYVEEARTVYYGYCGYLRSGLISAYRTSDKYSKYFFKPNYQDLISLDIIQGIVKYHIDAYRELMSQEIRKITDINNEIMSKFTSLIQNQNYNSLFQEFVISDKNRLIYLDNCKKISSLKDDQILYRTDRGVEVHVIPDMELIKADLVYDYKG